MALAELRTVLLLLLVVLWLTVQMPAGRVAVAILVVPVPEVGKTPQRL